MPLCSLCENITFEEIAVDYPPDFSMLRHDEPPGFSHHLDWNSLSQSAATCELCRLIKETGESEGILPVFNPKFDEIPHQIAKRNASQMLKLRAFRPGHPTSKNCGLSNLTIRNAQGLCVHLELFARQGMFDELRIPVN